MNIPKHGNFCMLLGLRPPELPVGYALANPLYQNLKKRLMRAIRKMARDEKRHFITGSALGADLLLLDALTSVKARLPSVYISFQLEDSADAMYGWSSDMRQAFMLDLDRCDHIAKTPLSTNASHTKMGFACSMFCSDVIALWDENQQSTSNQIINRARELTIENIEIII